VRSATRRRANSVGAHGCLRDDLAAQCLRALLQNDRVALDRDVRIAQLDAAIGVRRVLDLGARDLPVALRDPRDVVLSCFRRRFAMNAGMYEFTTLETTAAYYVAVMRLIGIYRQKLALDLIETRHESLVDEFESEMRRLCDFLGLSWQGEMQSFASRVGAQNIDTPSSAQVARGLSNSGLAQWRRYGRELAPVLPVLTPFVRQFGYPEN
jgi:hypothetical protein